MSTSETSSNEDGPDAALPSYSRENSRSGTLQLLREEPGARRELRRFIQRQLQLHSRRTPAVSKVRLQGKKKRPALSHKRHTATLRHRWLSRKSRVSQHPISDVLLALKKEREPFKFPVARKTELSRAEAEKKAAAPAPADTPAKIKTTESSGSAWKHKLRAGFKRFKESRVDALPPAYRWAMFGLILLTFAAGMIVGRYDREEAYASAYSYLFQEKQRNETLTRNIDIQRENMDRLSRELKLSLEENKGVQSKLAQAERELQRFDAVRGGLTITTVPEGATIKVGGDAVATTPATFQGLIAQTYPVEVELEGYEPVSLQAEVKPQQFTELGAVTLVRSIGSIDLQSEPAGANYELTDRNGEKITGKTPMSLQTIPAGRYHLRMSYQAYPDMEQEIVIRKGEMEKVFWGFGEGELLVKTEPEGAEISIDGNVMGKSPAKLKLPAGSHTVSVQFSPWAPLTKTVQVVKDLPADVSFSLTMGKVEITSDKSGTAIWSGDSFLGRTPLQMEIPTAKHDLWAFAQGKAPQNQELELGANESKSAEFHMSRDIDAKIDPKAAPSEQYLAIYLSIQEGEKLAADGKRLEAYKILTLANEKLSRFRKIFPDFERAIINNRNLSLQKLLTDLEEGRNPAKRSGPMIKVEGQP